MYVMSSKEEIVTQIIMSSSLQFEINEDKAVTKEPAKST